LLQFLTIMNFSNSFCIQFLIGYNNVSTYYLPITYSITTYQVHVQGIGNIPSMCGTAKTRTKTSFTCSFWSMGGDCAIICLCVGY